MKWVLIVIWVHSHAEIAGFARFYTSAECEAARIKVAEDFPKADELYCMEKDDDEQ